MKGTTGWLATGLATALLLAACASGGAGAQSTTSGSSGAGGGQHLKVGMAYDIGGRGDKSYNDAAAAGLDKASAGLGVQAKELEATSGETDAQKSERLRLLASAGYNPVIAVGFSYATALKQIAPQFPKTSFAIVDDASFQAPNVANLMFAEQQSSYAVGVIAAQATHSHKVGFIGGVNLPGIQRFYAGFAAGVAAVDPSIQVQEKYLTEPPDFSGFSDPAKAKTVAKGMVDSGVDVVYAAAGGSGSGVFDAAAAANGVSVIGVDSDQYQLADAAVRHVILTSAIKRVDTAVYDYIVAASKGTAPSGTQLFDLKNNGVGYATSNDAVKPYQKVADEYVQKIIAGTVVVPDSK